VRILLVQPHRLEVADVGVGRDVVLGEVVVDDVTKARVDVALLVQGTVSLTVFPAVFISRSRVPASGRRR